MFTRHQAHGTPAPGRLSFTDPSVPSRACCCPARPMVKVTLPPMQERRHSIDLWLCMHHYRASLEALQIAGARVEDLGPAPDEVGADRDPDVQHSRILGFSSLALPGVLCHHRPPAPAGHESIA